ncbi:hypothetical protein [Actinoplanes sp. TFC3]|uniref:hypothetical protein n=1 Tax=Actinoplanes sp. TFC3 TaxID=1710355 RepID=UPI000AB9FD00|nr:hypothetical protein [Actinoplanes sp. TFC3]
MNTGAQPRMIGGEMQVWSDLDGRRGAGPVRGTVLAAVFAAARGRILVLGPHDPALFDSLDDTTVLVRGVADARTLAGRTGLTVLCGSPAQLAAQGTFDTVIALDGLGRLDTTESDGLTWNEMLAVVHSVLAPDGLLVLGAENPLGLHRVVAPPRRLSDADWVPVPGDSQPATLTQLRQAAGDVTRIYCTYPDPVAPELILREDAQGGAVEAALERAFSGARKVLVDPARLAISSVRHGAGSALAPGWIIVAARDENLLPHVVSELDGAVPGPTLEHLIELAAARRDLPGVRELVTDWQSGPAAGVPANQIIKASDGTSVALGDVVDPAFALRDLASRLLRAGFPHPWPGVKGTTDLTRILAAMGEVHVEVQDEPGQRELPFAELVAERDRLIGELADARAQAAFFEAELTGRERDLREVREMVEQLSGTGPARAGQAFVGGVRATRRVLRRNG